MLTNFQKPQLQPRFLVFFNFVHSFLPLYLPCYLYLLIMFRAVLFMFTLGAFL